MKAFLLDIDGTMMLGSEPLPGAVEFVRWLRAEGRPHLWLTNNTSRSRVAWLERLEAAGFEPRPHELYTSGDATVAFLGTLDPLPRVYLVGPAALHAEFEAAGVVLTDEDADTVVIAYDVELTYAKLRRAALLLQAGAAFYATHPDVTCPTPEGPIPDVGSFLALFETACGRRPRVLGKPEDTMVTGALERVGVAAADAVMVGDRLLTDIAMARSAGLTSCLVLSGVTSGEELVNAPIQPDEVCPSMIEVLAWAQRLSGSPAS
ncbi:MAG: HAD-IIA family hydrolase [Planctomycetota bacterium]|nr:HAD-IIA family hydrolase [Planctomycetota bacterium]